MKRFFIAAIIFLCIPSVVFAVPEQANNKVGVSLLQPTSADIRRAAEMINSKGGDYGYVTLVIQENDRDRGKWQALFDELRTYHLIPIVRLATKPEGENWRKPGPDDASQWVDFLDSLNWVIKERYVVLFNEPNHATEWGGEVDAKSYTEVARAFTEKLHEKNKDFFVLFAGFDASAPSYPSQYEDEGVFLKEMADYDKDVFSMADGWASHSYPNPGFSGSPWDLGRKSVRGYEWEKQTLNSLGVKKDLPVFITETGWVDRKLSRETIASYYEDAFNNVWLPDRQVVAVTPFVFDYQTEPFLGFSFKKQGDDSFYPQYDRLSSLPKSKGEPDIIESGELTHELPKEFVAASSFHFILKLKNTGQAIWDRDSGYQLSVVGSHSVPFEYFFSDIKNLEPGREIDMSLYLKTNKTEGEQRVKIALTKNNIPIAQTDDWVFNILPLPRLNFQTSLFPKLIANNDRVEIQLYDDNEGLVYKKAGLNLNAGKGIIEEVQNIVFGKKYRVVMLSPYYLPRQTYAVFKRGDNVVTFKPMLPLDLNKDGKLSIDDVGALFKHPNLLGLFVP